MKVFRQTPIWIVISILIPIIAGVGSFLYFSEIIRKKSKELMIRQTQQTSKPPEVTSSEEEPKPTVQKSEISQPTSSCGVITDSNVILKSSYLVSGEIVNWFNHGEKVKITQKPTNETINETITTQDKEIITATAKIPATQIEAIKFSEFKTATCSCNFEESGSPTISNKPCLLKEVGSCSSEGEELKIVIVKHQLRLYCYRGDLLVKSYSIAIGKNPGDKEKSGDKRTPEGDFYVVSIENSKDWWHDFGDGRGPIKGVYGPWFLRLYTGSDTTKSKKDWTGIGIHGTHVPTSIGRMTTKGCIRMLNEDIEELRKLVKIGTRVSIID